MRASLLLALLIALVGGAFYWPILSGANVFYLTDINNFFEPLTRYAVERLKAGQIPLWNPYVYCGMPQIAVQSPGMWYLPNVIFLLLPFNQALAAQLILAQTAAGAGALLLALELGCGLPAATLAGVLLAFNGFMFSMDTNWTLAAGCGWFPWVLLFTLRTAKGTASGAELAIAMALFVTTGRPEVVVPGLVVASMFLWWTTRRQENAAVLRVIVAGALGLALAMPMLLPGLEWLRLSRRAAGMDPREVMMLSANAYDFLKVLWFPIYGDARVVAIPPNQMVAESGSLFLASAFVGPVAIGLALWAMFDRSWRGRFPLLMLLVVASILAAGLVPLPSAMRFPVKLLWLVVIALTALATRGAKLAAAKNPGITIALTAMTLFMLLLNAAMFGRQWAGPQFYDIPSISADTISRLNPARTAGLFHHRNFMPPVEMLDPISAAQYERQVLKPNTNIDFRLPSAWGFEGAAVGSYYEAFMTCLANSTQSTGLMPDGEPARKTDAPLAAFMREAAVNVVISQCMQLGNRSLVMVPPLDGRYFKELQKDPSGNVTYYEVLEPKQRIRLEPNRGVVDVKVDAPEHIVIETHNPSTCSLVIADQFYPGWRATINGVNSEILQYETFFRAIKIPPGTHTVALYYDPLSWKLGLLLAALGALGVPSIWLIDQKQRKAVKKIV